MPQRESSAGNVAEPIDLSEIARSLAETRRTLEGMEAAVLASVAESLASTAETLLEVSGRLEKSRATEWMDHEECAEYLIPFRFVSGIMGTCQRYSIRR
jgi:hypothetical protein